MNVNVQYGELCHKIQIGPDVTVSGAKKQLSDIFGIEAENINLMFKNKMLQDNNNISKYQIKDNSTLIMTATISIIMAYLNKTISIDILSDATVSDLRKEVMECEELGVKDFHLSFEGKDLTGNEKLNKYNIKHKSTVTIINIITIFIDFYYKKYEIKVAANAIVADVKRKVITEIIKNDINEIELRQIHLWSKERSVDNDAESIQKYDIKNKSIIKMREKIKINLSYQKREFMFEVFSDEKVSCLIDLVSKEARIKKDVIQLKKDRTFLLNDKDLFKYDLRESKLEVSIKMKISVSYLENKYQFENMSQSKVTDLKMQLKEKLNIETNLIHLDVSGREMNDEDELEMYGMDSLDVSMSRKVQVIAKDGDKSYIFMISLNVPVSTLKTLIKKKTGYNTNRISLELNGAILQDGGTLKSCGIEDGHTVMITSRVDGGMF